MHNNEKTPCPITYIIELINAKWTVELLREMAIGPVRTRRFLARIPAISMKSLRQRLQGMEEAGLITRTQYEGRPLRVEYSITERGRELFGIFTSMKELGSLWLSSDCTCSFENCASGCGLAINCPHRREDTRGRGRKRIPFTEGDSEHDGDQPKCQN
jgi:DNA-binding HxlR family transcriptional regulator